MIIDFEGFEFAMTLRELHKIRVGFWRLCCLRNKLDLHVGEFFGFNRKRFSKNL